MGYDYKIYGLKMIVRQRLNGADSVTVKLQAELLQDIYMDMHSSK